MIEASPTRAKWRRSESGLSLKKIKLSKHVRFLRTKEGHDQFIKNGWRSLAALAWNKYRAEGRGVVVIFTNRAIDTGAGFDGLVIPSAYIAEESEALSEMGGWPNPEVAWMVRRYNPEQEVIFLFIGPPDQREYERITRPDDLTPPQAAELMDSPSTLPTLS